MGRIWWDVFWGGQVGSLEKNLKGAGLGNLLKIRQHRESRPSVWSFVETAGIHLVSSLSPKVLLCKKCGKLLLNELWLLCPRMEDLTLISNCFIFSFFWWECSHWLVRHSVPHVIYWTTWCKLRYVTLYANVLHFILLQYIVCDIWYISLQLNETNFQGVFF